MNVVSTNHLTQVLGLGKLKNIWNNRCETSHNSCYTSRLLNCENAKLFSVNCMLTVRPVAMATRVSTIQAVAHL